MTFNACTPKNVIGDLIGTAALKHDALDPNVLEQLGDSGTAAFASKYVSGIADATDGLPDSLYKADIEEQRGFWQQLTETREDVDLPDGGKFKRQSVMGLITEVVAPHAMLGWDVVDAVDDKINDLISRGITGGSTYTNEMRGLFNSIPTTDMTPGQRHYFEQYKGNLLDSPFLKKEQGAFTNKLEAVTKGAVLGSPTVIGGNLIEPFMKGIPLYGNNFFKGMKNLIDERGIGGLIEELPELQAQGMYGIDIGERNAKGAVQEFFAKLDMPAKNLMYYVGMAAEGTPQGGRRAIQRTLFVPTAGNTPLAYHKPVHRSLMRLLSYSFGTMQLFHDVAKEAIKNPTPQSISTAAGLFGMYGVVTGIPAAMERNGEDVSNIPIIGPIWKAAAGVSSINLPDRYGIGAELFSQRTEDISKLVTHVFEGKELSAKDIAMGTTSAAFLITPHGGLGETIAANNNVRRIIKNSIDLMTGEKDTGEAFQKTFLPFVK
jgi:hypothetical protein